LSGLGGDALDARGEAVAHVLEDVAVGRGKHKVARSCVTALRNQGADPSTELLGGQLLLQSAQASVPEILHRFLWAVEGTNFTLSPSRYPQRREEKNLDLTRLRRAGSNTALFPIEQANEAEANLPAFQDAASAHARVSCAKPHGQGARCAARKARERPEASRRVGTVPGEPARSGQARFGLGAERRLAKKVEFERLLREGARRSGSGYTLFFSKRETGGPRLGIIISRKHAARATVRNGIKRCIREAFRLEQGRLGALDVLVRPPFGARPGARMLQRLRELFTELGK
jgi:ribonuclease P protein component